MNIFDVVVIAVAFVAVVIDFAAGLLRSLSVILAYLIAAPTLSPEVQAYINSVKRERGL